MNKKIDRKVIREFREAKMMTQESLAEAAKVNPRTIQRMEGEGVASSRTVIAVAKVLEVDPDDFLYVSEWEKFNDSFMCSLEENDEDEIQAEAGFLVFVICMLAIVGFCYFHSIQTGASMEDTIWTGVAWGMMPSMMISASVAVLVGKKWRRAEKD